MPRPSRIKLDSDKAIYHVYTRTDRHTPFFENNEVKTWIFDEILRLAQVYYIELYSFAVLPDHYRMALAIRKPPPDRDDIRKRYELFQSAKTAPEQWYNFRVTEWHRKLTDLSCFLKEFNSSIGRYINKRQQRSGRIWADRFKSAVIGDGPELLQHLSFIELSPVRSALCNTPLEYEWCSIGRIEKYGFEKSNLSFPIVPELKRLENTEAMQQTFALFAKYLAQRELSRSNRAPSDKRIKPLLRKVKIREMQEFCFLQITQMPRKISLTNTQTVPG